MEQIMTPAKPLLPCPFCKSEPRVEKFIVDLGHGNFEQQFWVECFNQGCRASMRKSHLTPDDAIVQWNTRPAPSVPEWMPIESFPQDGEWYLAVSNYGEIVKCYWDGMRRENDYHLCTGGGCWMNERIMTHWMPLPAAPENKGGES
jgi:hypothetical protein